MLTTTQEQTLFTPQAKDASRKNNHTAITVKVIASNKVAILGLIWCCMVLL